MNYNVVLLENGQLCVVKVIQECQCQQEYYATPRPLLLFIDVNYITLLATQHSEASSNASTFSTTIIRDISRFQ